MSSKQVFRLGFYKSENRLNFLIFLASITQTCCMPKNIVFSIVFLFTFFISKAQYIKVRLDFPVRSESVLPTFRGAIWIGPEWKWHEKKYIYIPGRWVRNKRFGAKWIPGYWNNTHKGYIWIPGRWRR